LRPLHHYNRLVALYLQVLILLGSEMDSLSNSDLIPTRDVGYEIDDFRDSIIEMKQQEGLTNEAVLAQLRREGLYTSSATLRRRLNL
jgi:hypothetical protein